MQKAVFTLLFVFVGIATASVANYYLRYLPRVHDTELREQRRKGELENARRCSADGTKFYNDYRRDMASLLSESRSWLWNDPEMHFSIRRNTCLIEISWSTLVRAANLYHSNVVLDVYSNREIIKIGYTEVNGEEKPIEPSAEINSSKEYGLRKDKLFGE
jgi:hypothetical protein